MTNREYMIAMLSDKSFDGIPKFKANGYETAVALWNRRAGGEDI